MISPAEELTDIKQCRDLAKRLTQWFWTGAYQRSGRYRIPALWLMDAYRCYEAADAAANADGRVKRTCAVWGPSGAGKSTLLSYFVDAPNGDSALQWPGGKPFRFRGSADFADALNPYNTRSDASSCVTRFFASETVVAPLHPVQVTLTSRRQILQALAAGYLLECRVESATSVLRDWEPNQIRGLLSSVGSTTRSMNKEAVELLLEVVSVIDRLGEDEHARYRKLRWDSEWNGVLKGALISDPERASALSRAELLAFELLWDSQEKITGLYRELEDYRDTLQRRFGFRTLFTSLKLASMILDIDAYPALARTGDYDPRRATDFEQLCRQARARLEGERVLLDVDGGGDSLFREPKEFGLFQALIWELAVPLRADFLQAQGKPAADFLEVCDLLDVPGVARQYEKASSEKINLKAEHVGTTELLVRVVKRGKTATIISRHAEQMLIDSVLLLVKAGDPPAQPPQLIGGVQSIWRAASVNPAAIDGKQRVPIAICLTMMSQLIDEMAAVGPDKFDPGKLGKMLSDLGPLVDPHVATIFMTTYPHLPAGSFSTAAEELRTRILPAMLEMPWLKERFARELERGSLVALIEDEDGGVGYLLRGLTTLLEQAKRISAAQRAATFRQKVEDLISEALPRRNPDEARHREVLLKVVSGIEQQVQRPTNRPEELTQKISSDLRAAFSFRGSDFAPYPVAVNDIEGAVHYLRGQLDHWVARQSASAILSSGGLDAAERSILFNGVRRAINDEDVAEWCVRTFGPISDSDEARHITRYIAAKCTHSAFEPLRPKQAAAAAVDVNAHCRAKFAEWSARGRPVASTPHYEAVIGPMLAMLRALAEGDAADRWEDQPGDPEIEALAAEWQAARGAA
jgi:Putative bacterial virulence factor